MVRTRAFVVSVGLIGISIAGCASSSGSSPVSATQAASDIASGLCARLDSCAPLLIQIGYGSIEACTSRNSALFADALAAPGTGWTPGAVEACAQAIPAASCDDALDHDLPDACRPPPGQLATGAACGDNGQCSSGYCNLGPGGMCGTCAAGLGAANAVCYRNDDCAYGTRCVGDDVTASPAVPGTCMTPGASGAACGATQPCASTLACSAAKGGVCGMPVAAGATCSQTADVFGTCGTLSSNLCNKATDGVCTKVSVAASGQACGVVGGAYTACSAGGTCATSGGASTCVAPAADFGNCAPTNGPGCLSPAACIGGTCVRATPTSCH